MYLKNETDETLVLLTLAGEQRAYEVLVRRYQNSVVASAISVTKQQFMAEDAAQDAFVTAWMKLNTLQEPKKYGSWVCRIAKNCALNMIKRYRSFLPLDAIENINIYSDDSRNPAEIYALSEEKEEIGKSIERLPERIKTIIQLHYFEGLSIADIADRMRISEGTVKSQLHDGRKRIRKELCAMNEKYSDTLVERVMKKVEELKLWQVKNDKSGFEKVYKDVLKEVEELPECSKKQHALADVLMRGWWWIPGKKNDALFARIVQAAMDGKNEEVMTFIVTREDQNVYDDNAKIEFIRDKQIPRLEKAGFVKTLGREWFWLGCYLFRAGKPDEGRNAYNKVLDYFEKDDQYRLLIPYALKTEELLVEKYKGISPSRYDIGAFVQEYRYIDKKLCFWNEQIFGEGYTNSFDTTLLDVFHNAASCDGRFFSDIKTGETHIGSDKSTLSFVSDSETVNTPAGRFENCQLWVVKLWNDYGKHTYKTYYKDGIGIVRQVHINDGVTESVVLAEFEIKGGNGLIPFAEGNNWKFELETPVNGLDYELRFIVECADEEKVMLTLWRDIHRISYDDNSWLEMISQIRNDYHTEKDGKNYICDIYPIISRAEELATTKMEKAHTKAATSVARRILDADPTLHPDRKFSGHWNFFAKNVVRKTESELKFCHNFRWSFEWKYTGAFGDAETPVLYNDIYGILQDATNCIWSDEWKVGATPVIEYTRWSFDVTTRISCEDGGTVKTKAGVFENCLKLCLDINGMEDGWDYRGGKKVYYFAEGVGIVRVETEMCGGARTVVYELTRYKGIGNGFMPMADGLVRKYEAQELTDGFVGEAEYTYVADEDGDIVIFADRTGIRILPPPITQYSTIQNEIIEDKLWDEGRFDESRLRNEVNNFHLLCHFLARPNRYWNKAEKAVAWNKYRVKLLENIADDGIPEGWLGIYSATCLRTACALFGNGQTEEGYEWLEKTFEPFMQWNDIPDGTELEVGDPLIFGGIKVVKGKSFINLPDGTKEPVSYEYVFQGHTGLLHYAMTSPHGWEWFNPVRNEERFKEYIQRAEKMLNKNS